MKVLVWSLTVVALGFAGCARKEMAPEPQAKVVMQLTSTSFGSNQAIPVKYTSYGDNVSPQLSWTQPPQGTKSLVLLVEDPDASQFVHWLVYNIPASDTAVPEGQSPAGGTGGRNDGGTVGYFGPKPPSGLHHYHFKLYAVDKALSVTPGATRDQVLKEINGHTLGQAELVGTYRH